MLQMPRIQPRPEAEMRAIFAKAHEFNAEKRLLYATQRHVVIVTPERQLFRVPCPKPGSMGQNLVKPIQEMLPKAKQRIVVIAFNDVADMMSGKDSVPLSTLARYIPFLGLLRGMSYVGHSVVIFEGHLSAVAAAVRDATMLIIDEQMVSILDRKVIDVAFQTMQIPNVYFFMDETLKKVERTRVDKLPIEVNPYTEGVADGGHKAEALLKEGNALVGREDPWGAIQKYTEAIDTNPNYPMAWLYRASVYLVTGSPDRAIADCTEAIRIKPDFTAAYVNRAAGYQMLRQYQEAIVDSTHAIQIDDKFVAAYYARARAYEAQGNTKAARADYQRILQLAPGDADAKKALQRLR